MSAGADKREDTTSATPLVMHKPSHMGIVAKAAGER